MFRRKLEIIVAGATGAVLVLLLCAVLGLVGMGAWIKEHEALAAWVQAVFSVLAIVAALLLGERSAIAARQLAKDNLVQQRKHEAEREATAEWREREKAFHLAQIAVARIGGAMRGMSSSNMNRANAVFLKTSLNFAARSIAEYAPPGLHAYDEISRFNAVGTYAAGAAEAIDLYLEPPNQLIISEARKLSAHRLTASEGEAAKELKLLAEAMGIEHD